VENGTGFQESQNDARGGAAAQGESALPLPQSSSLQMAAAAEDTRLKICRDNLGSMSLLYLHSLQIKK
jgi:hypothetical protein